MTGELTAAWLALAAQSEAQVAAAAAAYQAAASTRTRFIETAATSVYAANLAATATADVAVTAWRLALTGVPTPALGLLPPRDEQERLIRAFATITAHTEAIELAADQTAQDVTTEVVERSKRVARSEPWHRGQRAYQTALRARGVEQWVRVVDPDACDECADLAGVVSDISEDFVDHPSCRCTLAPAGDLDGWADRQRATQLQVRQTWQTGTGSVRFSSGITIRRA